MNRDDVIRMMQSACDTDKVDAWPNDFWWITQEELERFAALVAAEKEHQIIHILERLQERAGDSHNYYKYAINVIQQEQPR